MVVGVVFLGILAVFLMVLIGLSVMGHEIPCGSRPLVAILLSVIGGIGAAFIGGYAKAVGKVGAGQWSPLTIAVGGGVAAMIILMVISSVVLKCEGDTNTPSVKIDSAYAVPDGNGQEILTVKFHTESITQDCILAVEFSADGTFKKAPQTDLDDPSQGTAVIPIASRDAGRNAKIAMVIRLGGKGELFRTDAYPVAYSKEPTK